MTSIKMHSTFQIVIIVCLFKVVFSELKNCNDTNNPYKICVNSVENYRPTHPHELDTTLVLNEIVGIDEDENSISIQAMLISTWKRDPQLIVNEM